MFFHILSVLSQRMVDESYALVAQGVSKLHKLTKYSTLYELFNISEGASNNAVQKEFKRLLKQKEPIKGLTKDRGEKFITEAYNILTKYRDSYNYILKHDTFPTPSKHSIFYYPVIFILAFIVFDIFFMFYRNYRQGKMSKKELKKHIRKGNNVSRISFNDLMCVRGFLWVKGKTVG